MDLSALDTVAPADEGADMTLAHPSTGAPLAQANGEPITIGLTGKDSARYMKAVRVATNRRLANRKMKLTAEELEEETISGLVAATVRWSGILIDGASPECTPVNVRAFYRRFPAFREQAIEFMEDRANFLRGAV